MDPLQTVQPPSDVAALAKLPRDIAIIKLENDSMMSMAAMHVRSHKDILADVKDQFQTYKSLAQSAMYSKPVGKDRDTKQMKYARGLSIRAAEALAAAIGCNAMRENVSIVDEDTVQLSASFTDFARGMIRQKTAIVSKTYKSYQGQLKRHSDDRFYNVVVKAEMAKLRRDAILDMVPPGLKSELMLIADEQIMRFMDDATVEKMIAQFANKDVDVSLLETHLGRTRQNWTWDDRKKLAGIWASIEDGDSTVAEHFGEPAEPTESELTDQYRKKPDPPAGGASPDDASAADPGKGVRQAAGQGLREAPSAGGKTSGPSGGDAERQAVVAETTAAPSGGAAATTCGPLRTKLLQLHVSISDQGLADIELGKCGLVDTAEVRSCNNESALKEAIEALQRLKLVTVPAKGRGAAGKQGKLA